MNGEKSVKLCDNIIFSFFFSKNIYFDRKMNSILNDLVLRQMILRILTNYMKIELMARLLLSPRFGVCMV